MGLGLMVVLAVAVAPDSHFYTGFTEVQPLTIGIQMPGIVFDESAFNPADVTNRSRC
jgi:hypothetical protein